MAGTSAFEPHLGTGTISPRFRRRAFGHCPVVSCMGRQSVLARRKGERMAEVRLLDGGVGEEMIARSADAPTPLWATQAMIDHPGLAREVHLDYWRAGATISTANTYAIFHDRLNPCGLDSHYHSLHLRALLEAHEAHEESGQSGMIAGSMGPLGDSYRPDLAPSVSESAALYAEKARILAPHVDLILLETLPSLALAEGALTGAAAAGRPVWLSVTVDDRDGSRLRSGEPVAELRALVMAHPAGALLVNCSIPEAMAPALSALAPIAADLNCPFGAYANGFHPITGNLQSGILPGILRRPDLTPAAYAAFALKWVDMGARIVGGCCEIGPSHIRYLRDALIAAGHRII